MKKNKLFLPVLLSLTMAFFPVQMVSAASASDTNTSVRVEGTEESLNSHVPTETDSGQDADQDFGSTTDSSQTDPVSQSDDSSEQTYSESESSEVSSSEENGPVYSETETESPESETPYVTVTDLKGNETTMEIELSGYSPSAGETLTAAIWSSENGQDDLHWYPLKQSDTGIKGTFEISTHHTAGQYYIHIYSSLSGKMTFLCSTELNISSPAIGSVTAGDYNEKECSFQVTLSDIQSPSGVKKIQVPVWCAADQSDIHWYTATLQPDGSYTAEIRLSNHQYHSGIYQIHTYVTAENGIFKYTGRTAKEISADISVSVSCENDTYHVTAANLLRTDLKSITAAVWSRENGQDDLKWFRGTISSEKASAYVTYAASAFSSYGTYYVHLYGTDSKGNMILLGTTEYAVEEPTPPEISVTTDPEKATFTVTVTDVPASASLVQVPIWSQSDQSDLIWYTAVKNTDGDYTVTSDLSKHKYHTGTYQIHVYITPKNGSRYFAGKTTMSFTAVKGTVTVGESSDNRYYPLSVSDFMIPGGCSGVRFAVWSAKNGQDDLVWYTASKDDVNTWNAVADIAKHQTDGTYYVHAYGIAANGSMIFLGSSDALAITLPAASASISVENLDVKDGSFSIRLLIDSEEQVSEVQVPVWCSSDQSDICWYKAVLQDDGSYLVRFHNYNHGYHLGTYKIHAYCQFSNRLRICAGTTSQELNTTDYISVQGTTMNGTKTAVLQNCTGNYSRVQFAVWSRNSGQDDLIWYTASNNNGTWSADVSYSKHKHSGLYYLHVYADGKFLTGTTFYFNSIDTKNTWSDTLVAHALGGIDGNYYTNSLEAFENAYKNGLRTFEVDLQMTSDGKLVCSHGWDVFPSETLPSGYCPTEQEFLNEKILNKYTTLSFTDLCQLMIKYPDIWFITDTKNPDIPTIRTQYTTMISMAKEAGYTYLLDRFIVQIYSMEMYNLVDNMYHFPNYIFTMYNIWQGEDINIFDQYCQWSLQHKVNSICMWTYLESPTILSITNKYGLNLYVHTVNDQSQANALLKAGVAGVYTDDLKK